MSYILLVKISTRRGKIKNINMKRVKSNMAAQAQHLPFVHYTLTSADLMHTILSLHSYKIHIQTHWHTSLGFVQNYCTIHDNNARFGRT